MKKEKYECPELFPEEFRVEYGFTLSDPWNDSLNGSDDFNMDSSYDKEFE